MILKEVLGSYTIKDIGTYTVQPFGNGLINSTWKVFPKEGQAYLLQKINHNIFKSPYAIAENIERLSQYLTINHPDYLFITPIKTSQGSPIYFHMDGGYFRLFPFLNNSHSIDAVHTMQQAFEAAQQFALFTKLLSGFDAHSLNITLPDFHNISLRYKQFQEALRSGNAERVSIASDI